MAGDNKVVKPEKKKPGPGKSKSSDARTLEGSLAMMRGDFSKHKKAY